MPAAKIPLLNVEIDNISSKQLLAQLKSGGFVITPNVDHLVKLQNDPEFFYIYQHADYVVCDSQILIWVARFLGTPIQEKISGSDLFPAFCQYYAEDETEKVFLLGAAPGVARQAQLNINAKAGRELVVDTYSPPFGFERDPQECEKIITLINQSDANVLAVGLGAPKQEKWIYRYRQQLPGIKTFLAIGATIDFEAGNVRRSPQWMSYCGLEWLYRLKENPKRLWRRYLVESLPFLGWVVLQRFNRYRYHKPLALILHDAGLLSKDQVEQLLTEQVRLTKENAGKPPDEATLLNQYQWLKPETIRFFATEFEQLLKQSAHPPILDLLQQAQLLTLDQCQTLQHESQLAALPPEQLAIQKEWFSPQTVRFFQQLQALVENPQDQRLEQLFFVSPTPL
ncbi:MAG: WecB/TagA/CpsF family glycosyltransferase [Spirulina sp. SIO3F2]|nr:WecB/TagA/CpsF family glycosyltransferase [Spirulina sp. SIO3F2]